MDKKIKVIQVTHDLDLGGLQQVIVNICKTIDRNRFDISVLCLRSLGCYLPELEKSGVPVTLIPQKQQGTDYLSFLKVAQHFKLMKPDVIHTHNTQPFIDGTIAAKMTGVKRIIHTDHARSFPDKCRYMFAERIMSNFAFKVVGVSDDTSRNLMKYEHISEKKITTIPNGIDSSRYDIVVDKEKKRKEIGIRQSGPIIGVAVRLAEQKGLTYLLDAMPEIVKVYPDVSLVIAGDGPLKKELENQAELLGIRTNVFFLGLRLDINELLRVFDVYAMPSLWEGLPMILLEAMAAGCPIVATDVGGNSCAIKNNHNGYLINPANPIEIKNAILSILQNPVLSDKFKIAGKDIFFRYYDSTIMTKKYEALYDIHVA
jgi:glycosyltransferase involved in cell wall biosynthesis